MNRGCGPDLHDASREARRAYQQSGCMPDFDAIAALVAKRRQTVL
jgi:hypothetical protein